VAVQSLHDGDLERLANELRFLDVAHPDRRDEAAALRQDVDQPFIGKPEAMAGCGAPRMACRLAATFGRASLENDAECVRIRAYL
jgi:hypothetical protein